MRGRGNRLLAAARQARLGEKVTAGNDAIRCAADAGQSEVAVRAAIRALAAGAPLTWRTRLDGRTWARARASRSSSRAYPKPWSGSSWLGSS